MKRLGQFMKEIKSSTWVQNKFIMSATVLHLDDIRIGFAGIHSHIKESIGEPFLPPCSTGFESIESFNNDE
jgi:hypothetical protein